MSGDVLPDTGNHSDQSGSETKYDSRSQPRRTQSTFPVGSSQSDRFTLASARGTLRSGFDVCQIDTHVKGQLMSEDRQATGDFDGILDALEWRMIGPHRGGRVVAVAGHPTEYGTFYFGACAGGVWKTTDGGAYWENISDGYFRTAAIGALAVSDSDPNVIYAGTGETAIRGNVSHGDGIYKSTDGGRTWRNMGLSETRHIGDIAIHPSNPDLVYVAALGHVFGPNPERGVYRSTDGGHTWELVLHKSERAGAVDLSMDPNNPRTIYASIWQAQRYPYKLESGGEDCGIWKTTDGGDTWTDITRNPGLPTGVLGKIGVAVSPARSGRVWALVEATDGALFRSDDGGDTWKRLSEQDGLRWRAWYYMHIYADPNTADALWVLNGACWKSIDGGASFFEIPTPHGDNHDLWIDPRNPQRMIEGNDGGACVSFNGGLTWSTLYNQPTAQFYHVTTDNHVPYRVYGSQQDNSALALPSMSIRGSITSSEWFVPGGGESGYIALKPDDENIIFGGAIGSGDGNGRLTRYDRRTEQVRNVTVWPVDQGMGEGAESLKYRFQWTFPIEFSPHDPDVLYVTSNVIHRSTDEGKSWEDISPDLTRNDPATQRASGGPITKDNTGAEVYGTIFAFRESPHTPGTFWAGTDDGLVKRSTDGGTSWDDITPVDLAGDPLGAALISVIEPSPHDEDKVYLAATRYKHDDLTPYLFRSTDAGETWDTITTGIHSDDFTRVIREDPHWPGLLFAGTESGIYVSFDDGEQWQRLGGRFPVTPVYDLVFKEDDLVVATHGRSFWILDDLTPLRQLTAEARQKAAHLFEPRDTTRIRVYQGFGNDPTPFVNFRMVDPLVVAYRREELPHGEVRERFLDAGENPSSGVFLHYLLGEEPEGELTLTVSDAVRNEIRTFTSAEAPKGDDPEAPKPPRLPTRAGLNRFVWDMRYPPATAVPGDKDTRNLLAGPIAPPGTYYATLRLGDVEETVRFRILKDPRISAAQDELEDQFRLLIQIRDRLSETHDGINSLRRVRDQMTAWSARLAPRASDNENEPAADLRDRATALIERLNEIESVLIQVRAGSSLQFPDGLNVKLAKLVGFVDSDDAQPTRQVYVAFEELWGRIDQQLSELRRVFVEEVSAFNERVRRERLPVIDTGD
jgi:photosystem II stability/assembly factor-like uncharacterized protein